MAHPVVHYRSKYHEVGLFSLFFDHGLVFVLKRERWGSIQKSRFFCVDEKNQLLQLGSVVAYAHRMAQYINGQSHVQVLSKSCAS